MRMVSVIDLVWLTAIVVFFFGPKLRRVYREITASSCRLGRHDWFEITESPDMLARAERVGMTTCSIYNTTRKFLRHEVRLDRICRRCNKIDLRLQRALQEAEERAEHDKMLTEIVREVSER